MSTIKNYVIWTNCAITENQTNFSIEAAGQQSVRDAYDQMFRISQASVRKFLSGPYQELVITDPVSSRVEMFRQNWTRIWNLWHQEPCNILYIDSDVIFIRPTEIFNRFQEFRLFNWSDPKTNYEFLNYYNAGVRYYASSMRPETWAVGQATADHWNMDVWDYEQIVFNRMFWSQHVSMYDRHYPELNWQALHSSAPDLLRHQNQWNGLPMNQAHIIHFHGSRGASKTLEIMQSMAQALGLTY